MCITSHANNLSMKVCFLKIINILFKLSIYVTYYGVIKYEVT